MSESGVIPPPEKRLVCACGQPIKPCPVPLDPTARWLCAGYVHRTTSAHGCRTRDGVAEPAGEVTHVPELPA